MNRGYAFGFLIVLLIALLGMYVAVTGFLSVREAIRAQAPAVSSNANVSQTTRVPTRIVPTPTITPTIPLIPTPLPGTLETPVPTEAVPPSEVTEPAAPTQAPTAPEPTPLPVDTPAQLPPPTPQLSFLFRPSGPIQPVPGQGGCCYIFGTVRDAAGNPLEGVRLQASAQWYPALDAVSKGGVDLGKYDIPISSDKTTWFVIVVDANGNKISTEAVVNFDPGVAGWYRVDWQRTN